MKYDLIFGEPDIIKHDLMRILHDQFIANSDTSPPKIPAETGIHKTLTDVQPNVEQCESNLLVQANDTNKIKKCPRNPSQISQGDKILEPKISTNPISGNASTNTRAITQSDDSIKSNSSSIMMNEIEIGQSAIAVDLPKQKLQMVDKSAIANSRTKTFSIQDIHVSIDTDVKGVKQI